jgi:anaerobic magnesium-protoporphyrin IX monomethyl ester cyclase
MASTLRKEDAMKVCLIVPPSLFLLDERVFMTIGILKVAAALEATGLSVDVLDCSGIANFEDVVRDYCRMYSPDVFGLTATTPQLPPTMRINRILREEKPRTKIILGGPHVTLINAAHKNELITGRPGRATRAFEKLAASFDVLVAGDGEEAIFTALRDDTPKLVDADDTKSALFLSNKKLEELPFPARHLVDTDSYHYSIDGVRAFSLIAQLGCPFECGFCGGRESPSLRRIRTRSNQNVVAEIVHLFETYGVKGFMLYDDELNVNKQMVDLMRQIKAAQDKLGVEFRLRGFIKAELFTEAQAEAMYAAGFRWILTGFESGSPRILQNINKKSNQDENTRCVQIARKYGLKMKALMSIGHPGESDSTIKDTEQWLLDTRPDDFDITIITTYPGTPYYDRAIPHPEKPGEWIYTFEKNGDRLYALEVDYEQEASYYKGNPHEVDGNKSFVYTDHLTREQIVTRRHELEATVRKQLGIPYPAAAAARQYEHSMGQMDFPKFILRSSTARA